MDNLILEQRGPVTLIQINRPQKRNAVDASTAAALREAWLAFDADEAARVAILTGGDEVFSAGAVPLPRLHAPPPLQPAAHI